jgi:2-polyprenyl-6-methoxyphenol hydroxylase-like FAD-dependent oxidoreductase
MTDDVERQVLVTGAGITGLAFAGFLRTQGLDPVVVDRSDRGDGTGVGLTLWSNGLSMLDHLGVVDHVRAAGTVVTRLETRAPDGSVLDARAPPYGDARPFVTVRDARLCGLLRDRLPDGTVRTDTAVEALRSVDDAVEVRFDDGVREQFDVVVGTRSRRSPVHDRVREADATDHETTGWRVSVDDEVGTPGALTEVWSDDARFLFAPLADGGTGYLSTRDDGPAAPSAAALRAAFDDVQWLLPAALARLDDADVVRVHGRGGPVGRLTAGRVALVGDAVRVPQPTPGVGASVALEDAFVLTDELLTRPVPAALCQYAVRRRDRTARLRRTGVLASPDEADRTAILDRVRRFLSDHGELMAQFYARQRRPLSRDVLDDC